jgi:hypothetical protein
LVLAVVYAVAFRRWLGDQMAVNAGEAVGFRVDGNISAGEKDFYKCTTCISIYLSEIKYGIKL